jgi:hypothetical protein
MANQRTLEFIRQQLVDRWNLFRQEHPRTFSFPMMILITLS